MKLLGQVRSLNGVTGPISFDFKDHDREQYAYKLWNLQGGEFVHDWTLERSQSGVNGNRTDEHSFDLECYVPSCVEKCATFTPGECAGLVFPDGSSLVPLDTVGTQAERGAEAQRFADLALAAERAEEQVRRAEVQREAEVTSLWELIRNLVGVIVTLGRVTAGGFVFNRMRKKTLVQRAGAAGELAAEYKKAALSERMGDILMPESWCDFLLLFDRFSTDVRLTLYLAK